MAEETTETTESTEQTTTTDTTVTDAVKAGVGAAAEAIGKAWETASGSKPNGDGTETTKTEEKTGEEKPAEETTTTSTQEKFKAYTEESLAKLVDGKPEEVKPFLEGFNNAKLSEDAAKSVLGTFKTMGETAEAALTETHNKWAEELTKNEEFGGDKLEASVGKVASLVKEFGGDKSDEIQSILKDTGLDKHPVFMPFVMRVASQFNEGKPAALGRNKPTGGGSTASKLFD